MHTEGVSTISKEKESGVCLTPSPMKVGNTDSMVVHSGCIVDLRDVLDQLPDVE